jgi:hypothetical protein
MGRRAESGTGWSMSVWPRASTQDGQDQKYFRAKKKAKIGKKRIGAYRLRFDDKTLPRKGKS